MKVIPYTSAFLSLALLTGCAKSPESTVESFYKAVGKGEIADAQTYLSAQVVGMLGPQKLAAALAEESQRVSRCGGIKAVEVALQGQGEVRAGTALISYSGNCQPRRENVKLVKEEGKWKIAPSK